MRIVAGLVLAGAVGVARSGCFEVAMFDAWEDGWNGAAWAVSAWNSSGGDDGLCW